LVQFIFRQRTDLLQNQFHPRDALPRAANVPALAAIRPARTGQTVISTKYHRAAAEQVDVG
jgi:hypothetical protein